MGDDGEVLRGYYSEREIKDFLGKVNMSTYFSRFLDQEHEFVPPGKDSSNTLLARRLVEVFKVKIYNLTEEDLEIYGTVEIVGEKFCTRYIYYREKNDSVVVKGNQSAYLLLNGPKSVFGLESSALSFAAYLRDKRDGRLIHVGYKHHPSNVSQKVMTIRLRESHLLYMNDHESSIPKDEEVVRMYSMRIAVTYGVYEHAVAASLQVYPGYKVSSPVLGYITAASNLYPGAKSYLYCKKRNDAPWVDHGCEIKLSKSLVAVPCDGALFLKVFLPELACCDLAFRAKQNGFDSWDNGRIKVVIKWQLRCDNKIELIQEKKIAVF